MKKQEPNYKAFIPIGITFMGAGVALSAAVNPGIGVGLIGVGIVFIIIGIKKSREEANK